MANLERVREVKPIPITLDKERSLRFDLNAFAELEEIYGSIDQAIEDMSNGKVSAIRAILYAGLKHEDDDLTLKQVGSFVGFGNIQNITEKIGKGFESSLPAQEEDSEGATKNE